MFLHSAKACAVLGILTILFVGCGEEGGGPKDRLADDTDNYGALYTQYTCSLKWQQMWPKPSAGAFGDMNDIEYQKDNLRLDLEGKTLAVDESEMKPFSIDVTFSPNINNFKFDMVPVNDPKLIQDAGYDPAHFGMLRFEVLSVVRDFERSIKTSSVGFIDRRLKKFKLSEEIAFGPERTEVGTRRTSEDDFEESSILEEEAPAVLTSLSCVGIADESDVP